MEKERLEFEQSLDGLFKGALQAGSDIKLIGLLRDAGLDLTKKLQPAYPAADFFRWVKVAAKHRWPDLGEDEGARRVGRLAVERGLRATLLGDALLKMLKLVGVKRALMRIGRAMRNGNNYVEGDTRELGPTSVEVVLGPLVGPASYYEGILETGPKELGAKTVTVTQTARDGEKVTFRVDWTA